MVASHVVEHLVDPKAALKEMALVGERVYVIVPAWWTPHCWLHPNHLWAKMPGGKFVRIRRARNENAIGGMLNHG